LKRISVIQGLLKLEISKIHSDIRLLYQETMFDNNLLDILSNIMHCKILLNFEDWDHADLPPNFSVIGEQPLINEYPIYHLGRFAEAKPKVMMGDMIERAYDIKERISESDC